MQPQVPRVLTSNSALFLSGFELRIGLSDLKILVTMGPDKLRDVCGQQSIPWQFVPLGVGWKLCGAGRFVGDSHPLRHSPAGICSPRPPTTQTKLLLDLLVRIIHRLFKRNRFQNVAFGRV